MRFTMRLTIAMLSFCAITAQSAVYATNLYVDPTLTDPGVASTDPAYINDLGSGQQHFVSYATTGTPKVLLFVFLGGTATSPAYYTDIIKEAAVSTGPTYTTNFASIGLAYPNGTAIKTINAECTTSDCLQVGPGQVLTMTASCRREVKAPTVKMLFTPARLAPTLQVAARQAMIMRDRLTEPRCWAIQSLTD